MQTNRRPPCCHLLYTMLSHRCHVAAVARQRPFRKIICFIISQNTNMPKCSICHQEGHNKKKCPKVKNQQKTDPRCGICHEVGHDRRKCPENPKKSNPKKIRCTICRKVGHNKSKCPDKEKEPEPWIEWDGSEAQDIILSDLYDEIIPLDEDVASPELVYDVYRHHAAFVNVPFAQFYERLRAHRKQVARDFYAAREEFLALQELEILRPRKTHNHRGELVFDVHPAKELLRKDVERMRHQMMKPSELQHTRPEYMEFKPKIFRERIYQEIRRWKFCNWRKKQLLDAASKRRAASQSKLFR